ncbi:hypothetical protein TPHA_0J01460 [Tetrapisispora phaffii CBS 4417]|uniref:t-SNARE coiled-coil homology domain-containing protein n=1 Tax=Tetrapisispora phaffii (strain ATCC 24235 / CBS 4417 / NBRC 1672 / NRRL Y-8282 / UCD 70-5) TaxID=1071381 RepID=G8BYM6_TETPH|nr:hypothetical protein TPHA_0J01460 [Tetrapisispora phaffii CBS 4417]CCE64968.1 hypothetical protein TPHA_0J01460 [Tetrapisispora phaffii CBS 4417]
MSSLTELFKQYVNIIEESQQNITSVKKSQEEVSKDDYIVDKSSFKHLKDSFLTECSDLMKYLRELRKVLATLEPQYNADSKMSEMDKDDFDTEFRLQLQQYVSKFKHLQKYENERQQLIETQIIANKNSFLNFLNGTNPETIELHYKSVNEFRLGVLRSLSIWLNKISNQFTNLQQERIAFQRKFEALDLNSDFNITPPSFEVEPPVLLSVSQSQPQESVQDEIKHYNEAMSKLSQEQIQLLETEHEELLNMKNDQLKKVENINKTIMEVVSLQNELASHLSVQSQNINNMMDNQDDIEVNIKQGNKQLTKAQKKAGKAAKLTTYSAIFIGILLLLLDYIS